MKEDYSQTPTPVKSADAEHSYPFLWCIRNFIINSIPLALIWLVAGIDTLAAALAAFFMLLLYCLAENYVRNRHLSEMARKLKEHGNA